MDNTTLIAEMEGSLTYVEQLLERFSDAQDDDSDVDNEDRITKALDTLLDLQGCIGDLVP